MEFGSMFDGMGSWITLIVTVPFLVIALIFLVYGLRTRSKMSYARRTWQQTQGRVLFSQVESRTSSSSEGGTSTSYYPRVVYEYAVGGNRYQGSRVGLGREVGIGSYRRVEQKVMGQYPAGALVPVYYNPVTPQEAALEMNAPAGNLFLIIAVVIVAITACTLVFMAFGMGVGGNIIDQVMQLIPGMSDVVK